MNALHVCLSWNDTFDFICHLVAVFNHHNNPSLDTFSSQSLQNFKKVHRFVEVNILMLQEVNFNFCVRLLRLRPSMLICLPSDVRKIVLGATILLFETMATFDIASLQAANNQLHFLFQLPQRNFDSVFAFKFLQNCFEGHLLV